MQRLKEWARRERQKLSGRPLPDVLAYVWEYYKLWIIGIVFFVCFGSWAAVRLFTTPADTWLFACFANTNAPLGNGTAFYGGFVRYAGYDLSEKKLEFNASIYCDPAAHPIGSSYYETLIAFLDSGALDVLVMEEDDITALGATGRLLDLEDARLGGFAARWAGKLVYAEPYDPDYGKPDVAVGIDLDGSMLVGENAAYPGGAVLGISAKAAHLDQAEVLLRYLFEETMPS